MSHTHNARTGKDECRMKGTMPGLQEIVLVVNRADSSWNTTKKSLISVDKTVRQVSGLGDDAYTGRMVGYNVRKGNRAIQVFGDLTNNDTANEKATRLLAERAVARL